MFVRKFASAPYLLLTLFVGSSLACGGESAPADAPTAPRATASAKGGSGLDHPGNKADVVAAVRELLDACSDKWDDKKGFDQCYDPINKLREKKLEGVEETALNLVESNDAKLRAAGMILLGSFGSWERRRNKEQSTRLLAVLEKLPAGSPMDGHLTYMLTDTDASTGLHERFKTFALAPNTSFDVKAMVAGWWRNPMGFELVQTLASSSDPKELHAASQGYAIHFKDHEKEACGFWAEHFESEHRELRSSAVGHLTGGWSGNTTRDSEGSFFVSGGGGGPSAGGDAWCAPKQVDKALDLIAKRVKANGIDESNYIYGLGNLAQHAKTTPPQKKKALAILKKIVETKNAPQRGFALSKLGDVDLKGAKVLAKKFAKDDQLKWSVDNILAREKK